MEPDSAEAQALILQQKEQQRIDETTIDALTSFDNNNSEADKNYKFNKSSVGVYRGEPYRDGQRATDAYFQYDMIVDPSQDVNYLGVRYYGGDSGRTFDVYLNDVLLKHETVTNANGSTSWYIQYDEIPREILDGIAAADSYKRDQNGEYVLDGNGQKVPIVTVRFQGNGTSYVGGVYGVYTTLTSAYSTDAALTSLAFDNGRLSPAFDPVVREYTLTVPTDATTTNMQVSPTSSSGLVYVNDVLIDDTQARTIALAEGDQATDVIIKSVAQDHETSIVYTVHVVKGPPAPIELAAEPRCVAGKVQLIVKVTNSSEKRFHVVASTEYGRKALGVLPAGATAERMFTTRATAITGGSVSATATVAGDKTEVEVEANFKALDCG